MLVFQRVYTHIIFISFQHDLQTHYIRLHAATPKMQNAVGTLEMMGEHISEHFHPGNMFCIFFSAKFLGILWAYNSLSRCAMAQTWKKNPQLGMIVTDLWGHFWDGL